MTQSSHYQQDVYADVGRFRPSVSSFTDTRLAIGLCVQGAPEGLTAIEVAELTGLDCLDVLIHIGYCGLIKTYDKRDGRCVWVSL